MRRVALPAAVRAGPALAATVPCPGAGAAALLPVALLLAGGLIAAAGCGGRGAPAADISAAVPLQRHVIAAPAPGGPDCCSDICITADVNGDGYPDVVIGAEGDPTAGLVWYEFPHWPARAIGQGRFTTDGQAADLDGDGDLDLVVGDLDRGIVWFENPGAPGGGEDGGAAPPAWVVHLVGEGGAHDLEAGDLDGDGLADLIVCDKQSVSFWRRSGPDAWQPRTLIERRGEGTALADLDGDGDLDVVLGGLWLENPGGAAPGPWPRHEFAPAWPAAARVCVADLDGDGRLDVALSASEGKGDLAWFAAPSDPRAGSWRRRTVARGLVGAHSLRAGDLDGDGDIDLVVAEMHTSPRRRVVIHLNEGAGERWRVQTVARTGSHNLRLADVDADGDLDLVGKNYGGRGRAVELWENLARDAAEAARPPAGADTDWEHICLDDARGPEQRGMMGLVFADVDGDGWTDIVAGSLLYRNPAGDLAASWPRTALPETADVCFHLDADGDELADLVAFKGDGAWWLEAADRAATGWTARRVATVPPGRTQGYAIADLSPGGTAGPELIFTRDRFLLALRPPGPAPSGAEQATAATAGQWRLRVFSDSVAEDGLAAGDVDGDGDVDLAAVAAGGLHAVWLENPAGDEAAGPWRRHAVAPSLRVLDRIGLADLDGDGRLDLIATQESPDLVYNGRVLWFAAPEDPAAGRWRRRAVVTLRSANSLDLADLDGDGAVDLVVAEHTDQRSERAAADNLTAVLFNRDQGSRWLVSPVEIGSHSSHLGARLCDLDHDGAREIVSLAWQQYRHLHLWRQRR